MKYSFTCPLDNQTMSVDAKSTSEAADKLTKEAEHHMKTRHPNVPLRAPERLKETIKSKLE